MFFGVHLLLYSHDAEADRAFFRDMLGFTAVDAGHGWLIFAMPPAEMAVHPSEAPMSVAHVGQDLASGTVYLMCKDLAGALAKLEAKGLQRGVIQEARWGVVTSIPLPGGGNLGLYEPRHPLAIPSPAG